MQTTNYHRLTMAERIQIGLRMVQRYQIKESVVSIANEFGISRKHCYQLEEDF